MNFLGVPLRATNLNHWAGRAAYDNDFSLMNNRSLRRDFQSAGNSSSCAQERALRTRMHAIARIRKGSKGLNKTKDNDRGYYGIQESTCKC
jgi:hypothetical protein